MNKVLVTGLAIGREVGICDACNFDFDWIYRYPSVLLWADKILVTDFIWGTISESGWPSDAPALVKSLKLVFDLARDKGIIEIVDPTKVASPELKKAILAEVDKDRILLAEVFPHRVKLGNDAEVPGQLFIDGNEYCSPFVGTIYTGLALARAWGAHCLFSRPAFDYCAYKFGLVGFPDRADVGRSRGFQTVFEAYLPNVSIFPDYALYSDSNGEQGCHNCIKEQECKDSYLSELETNVKRLFAWRDYDEIGQLKETLEDITRRRDKSGGIINPSDILHDFRSREEKLRKRIRSTFPKVRRWANTSAMLSVPVALAGLASDVPLITFAGAGLAGLSRIASELVDLFSSKYSWIGFLSREAQLHRES